MNGRTVLVLVAFVTPAFGQSPVDSPATLAAKSRQEAIKSIELLVRVKQTVEPKALKQSDRAGTGTYPKERKTFESVNRLVFDGNKIRFEDNHPIPNASTMDWVTSKCVYVSDGECVKFYQGPAQGLARENCVAKVSTVQTESVAGFRIYTPIHLACRGYHNPSCRTALTFGQLKPTGLISKIKGESVEEYLKASTEATNSVQAWVDAKSDYLPRRLRYNLKSGGPSGVTDIVTERDTGSGHWLPKTWVHTIYSSSGDKVQQTYTVTIESFRVNGDHARSEFDLTFPEGVEVYDDRTGEYKLSDSAGGGTPLTRAGGEPSGDATAILSRYWWVITCCLAVLVIATGWLVYRRKSRHGRGA
jgi:hypothetical protein